MGDKNQDELIFIPGVHYKSKLNVSKLIASYADSYADAATELWDSALGRGEVSNPSLVLAAFAVELYLKAFNAEPEFTPNPNGLVHIETHEYAGPREHRLSRLYDNIPEPVRFDLGARFIAAKIAPDCNLRGTLADYDRVFVDVRYLHEPKNTNPLPRNPDVLLRIARFFQEVARAVPEYPNTVRL